MKTEEIAKAFNKGWNAALEGKTRLSCPYNGINPGDIALEDAWLRGFKKAKTHQALDPNGTRPKDTH